MFREDTRLVPAAKSVLGMSSEINLFCSSHCVFNLIRPTQHENTSASLCSASTTQSLASHLEPSSIAIRMRERGEFGFFLVKKLCTDDHLGRIRSSQVCS